MTKVAMTGDLVRARYVRLAGTPYGLQVGVDQPCCNECQPCCECNGIEVPEACGELQQIIVQFDFQQLGDCFPTGGTHTVTLTPEDEDNGFPFSKTVTFAADNGNVTINVALFCDGVAFCYVITGTITRDGCTFCGPGALTFSVRLNGTDNENGDCCPSGAESEFNPCNDAQATISVTLVY